MIPMVNTVYEVEDGAMNPTLSEPLSEFMPKQTSRMETMDFEWPFARVRFRKITLNSIHLYYIGIFSIAKEDL